MVYLIETLFDLQSLKSSEMTSNTMSTWPLALALSQAMGLIVFGLGIVLVLVGVIIIVIREIVKSFISELMDKANAKVRAGAAGPWDFLTELLKEIFAIIKELPEPLQVAFLLIIIGIGVTALGYSMVIGYWPPIS